MNILESPPQTPAQSPLETTLEQLRARYGLSALEMALKKLSDQHGQTSLDIFYSGHGKQLSAVPELNALQRPDGVMTAASLFGEKVGALDEAAIRNLEECIPELAAGAVKQAYYKALASGATVLEASDGNLVETSAGGSQRIVGVLPSSFKVAPGLKRMRRIKA